MIKNYPLLLIAFICFSLFGYGQGFEDFTNSDATASYGDSSFVGNDGITWTYVASRDENGDANGSGIDGNALMLRRTNDNSKVTSSTIAGGIGDFSVKLYKGHTGAGNRLVELFINGVSQGTSTVFDDFNEHTFTINGINITGNISIEIRNTTSRQVIVDDITWTAYSPCTDEVDYANIQEPTTTQTITVGGDFFVYAQAYEPGITPPAGANANISAWIGYSTTNTDPSTWTNWVPAPWFAQGTGAYINNDEYRANIGPAITVPGTYYYASRFELNGCAPVYGGTGGIWNNNSVELIVEADQVDFCNVDFPKTAAITVGNPHTVYAQAYEPGVTDAIGQGANLEAWIGYNTVSIDHEPWDNHSDWTWVPATYNNSCFDCNGINNDEYFAEIGSALPAGTYFYASRFRLNGSEYSYGGIDSDNIGNFWDKNANADGITPNSGVLTVANAPCAELMISEYVEGTGNNKYIEIYNPTGVTIDLSNYSIAIYSNGSVSISASYTLTGTLASFGTYVIAHGNATIYTGADTSNNVATGFNGNDVVALQTTGEVNIDVLGVIGSSAMFGENKTLRRQSTVQSPNTTYTVGEWSSYPVNTILGLGNHLSDCEAPSPNLQLVDATATNQNCGFTIDYGNVAIGATSDLTFDIKNIGSLNLIISSIDIIGDYTIMSPVTFPFTITPGNSQTFTVRFAPLSDDSLTGELTINSNDLDEAACVVNLTGVGFTPGPNINIRGINGGSNPTIPNGSTTTSSLNNTRFAQQTINTTELTKTFRIGNEAGSADLNVSSITLTGDTADFFVTSSITNPLAVDTFQDFTITFRPTTLSGVRSATVTISNSDSNKNPYTYVVEGTANCPSVSGTLFPSEGPAGTIVRIVSPGNDLTSATAELNGVPLTTISSSSSELEVRLPNSITTGGPLSIQLTNGCVFSNTFTLINKTIAGCEASTSATVGDLFISEVTDSPRGSLTYVELYNATGATINFASTNYRIRVYNNGNTLSPKELIINSGTVANNSTYVIALGVSGAQCTVFGGDGTLAQAELDIPGASINFYYKPNGGVVNTNMGHDFIGLYSASALLIDSWGVFGDQTWAAGLGLGESGANFERITTATLPNTTYSNADWIITNWDDSDCSSVDYSTIGNYDFSIGVPPTLTLQPVDSEFACIFTASFSIAGTEGFPGSAGLAYQWYFNAPGTATWTAISPANLNYSGSQLATLNINDTSSLNGYQYYCQLREDDATCFTASNAARLEVLTSVWDGTNWSSPPTFDRFAIINADYDTSIGLNGQTSFEACGLSVNSGILKVDNDDYVEVITNVAVEIGAEINIETQGAFIQRGIGAAAGTFTLNGGASQVSKYTAPLANWYDYTYWSSPVATADVDVALWPANPGRRYWHNANNYIDTDGDDVDDDDNDWLLATGTGTMVVGRGYAATHRNVGFTPGLAYQYIFEGALNTGDYSYPIVYNSSNITDHWNLVGNPYPSAIKVRGADGLFEANAGVIKTAVYLWSHDSPPLNSNPGNQQLNFNTNDYAVINEGMSIAGASGIIPGNYIPSGQSFFVSGLQNTDIIFNNAMRLSGEDSNELFFRNAVTSNSDTENYENESRLWINLTAEGGVFSQLGVGYFNNATDGFDGLGYDARRNLSSGSDVIIYSKIEGEDHKLAIQGKAVNSLNTNEVIPIGFSTSINETKIYEISLYQFEGEFLGNHPVYIRDFYLNTFHNLKDSDYSFTSEAGTFDERFTIVFNVATLSIDDNLLDVNSLSLVELANGDVEFKVNSKYQITNVEILDVLGRRIYNLKGHSSVEVYDLSQLSQSAYIAKVTLSNGQVISKKSIKRK